MPHVTLIEAGGTRHTLDIANGVSVMQAAVAAGVRGIVGECGGSAMCATCHVHVEPDWLNRLPAPLSTELEMLDCTATERRTTSRLSCQIKVQPALDGLVLYLPERQQ